MLTSWSMVPTISSSSRKVSGACAGRKRMRIFSPPLMSRVRINCQECAAEL